MCYRVRMLWSSRHELNERNWEILKKAFGDNVEIVQYKDTVTDVNKLKEIADKNGVEAYIVVLPPHLIQQLMQVDKRPIYRFVVDRKVKEDGSVEFVPIGLERIKEIKVVTERIV